MILDEWFDAFISRPVGNRLAHFFHGIGMSANAVSVIAAVLGIASGICFAGTGLLPMVGGFLLISMVIIDCADGAVARMSPPSDKPWKGRMIDGYADLLTILSVHIGIAVHLSRNDLVVGGYAVSGLEFSLLAIAAFFSLTWNSSIVDHAKQRLKPHSVDRCLEDYRDQPKTLFERFLFWSIITYTRSASKTTQVRHAGSYDFFRQVAVSGPSHRLVLAAFCGMATMWAPMAFLNYLLLVVIVGNLYMWFIMSRARRHHPGVQV